MAGYVNQTSFKHLLTHSLSPWRRRHAACTPYRASSASSVRPATPGLRRSADRLRRVLCASVIITTPATVIETRRFAGVHTTLPGRSVTTACPGSTATPALVDQVTEPVLSFLSSLYHRHLLWPLA